MMPRHRAAAGLLPALLVTLVGLTELVRERNWDLVTILAAAAVFQLAGLVAVWRGRQTASLRPDLAAWLHEHAAATGEPVDRIVDRAVVEHQAGLAGERR